MRIKITVSVNKSGIVDFNYQHQIQALLYDFLSVSDPDYSCWLHELGYVFKRDKSFKLFVYSGIIFDGKVKIVPSNDTNQGDGTKRRAGFSFSGSKNFPFTFSFQIASPVSKFIQHLVDGIFREGNEIMIGQQAATIHRVETLPDPLSSSSGLISLISINLRPLESPIFIKKPMPPGERDIYVFPGDEGYEEFLNRNLAYKYETLYGKPYHGDLLTFQFHSGRGKSVKHFNVFKKNRDGGLSVIHIKGTLMPFTVTGPKELIRVGLECGFGQNNSMGCGYVEVVQEIKQG